MQLDQFVLVWCFNTMILGATAYVLCRVIEKVVDIAIKYRELQNFGQGVE